MNAQHTAHGLNITLAVGASDPLDPLSASATLTKDLRLVKASLLYADHVTLYSPITSLLLVMSSLKQNLGAEELNILEGVLRTLGIREPSANILLDQLRSYRQIAQRAVLGPTTDEEARFTREFKTAALSYLTDLAERMKTSAEKGRSSELIKTIDAGILDVHRFKSPTNLDSVSEEFAVIVDELIREPHDYPLLDHAMATIFRQIIQQGQATPSDSAAGRSRQVALAANLIERLPVFDEASVDELLDIRRELADPLIRFRRAVIMFSDAIRTAAWDSDFEYEIQNLFAKEVAPAVSAIEEDVRANRIRERILDKALDDKDRLALTAGGLVARPSLGLLASHLTGIPELATASAAGASVAAIFYAGLDFVQAIRESVLRHREIAENGLFFYYKAGEQLRKRQSKRKARKRRE